LGHFSGEKKAHCPIKRRKNNRWPFHYCSSTDHMVISVNAASPKTVSSSTFFSILLSLFSLVCFFVSVFFVSKGRNVAGKNTPPLQLWKKKCIVYVCRVVSRED